MSGMGRTPEITYNLRLSPPSGAGMLKKFVLLVAFFMCGAALADEASVRKLVEAKLGAKVQNVTKTPYGGLYEVSDDKSLYYTDENVSFMRSEERRVGK